MLKKQFYLGLCLLTGIASGSSYADSNNQEAPAEQRSFVSGLVKKTSESIAAMASNTYDTFEAEAVSIFEFVKYNPIKTFLLVSTLAIIIGTIDGSIWRSHCWTSRDIHQLKWAIERISEELKKLSDVQKTDIAKVLGKLQTGYKRS